MWPLSPSCERLQPGVSVSDAEAELSDVNWGARWEMDELELGRLPADWLLMGWLEVNGVRIQTASGGSTNG